MENKVLAKKIIMLSSTKALIQIKQKDSKGDIKTRCIQVSCNPKKRKSLLPSSKKDERSTSTVKKSKTTINSSSKNENNQENTKSKDLLDRTAAASSNRQQKDKQIRSYLREPRSAYQILNIKPDDNNNNLVSNSTQQTTNNQNFENFENSKKTPDLQKQNSRKSIVEKSKQEIIKLADHVEDSYQNFNNQSSSRNSSQTLKSIEVETI